MTNRDSSAPMRGRSKSRYREVRSYTLQATFCGIFRNTVGSIHQIADVGIDFEPLDPLRMQKAHMRVAANHKQGLKTSLSTCTEPWLQRAIAPLENPLMGFLPHTTTKAFAPWNSTNRTPFRCREPFSVQSRQTVRFLDSRTRVPGITNPGCLIAAKRHPLMQGAI